MSRYRSFAAAVLLVSLASVGSAQGAPLAQAFRDDAKDVGKNLMAAADLMPADKFSYKPTAPQMTFADIVVHLSQGNDFLCSAIGGAKAPTRAKVEATATKAALVARLKETFDFCDGALAKLDDAKLTEQLPMFGGKTMSRAAVEILTVGDWADHYSQMANYLRLNNLVPPTAKK